MLNMNHECPFFTKRFPFTDEREKTSQPLQCDYSVVHYVPSRGNQLLLFYMQEEHLSKLQ